MTIRSLEKPPVISVSLLALYLQLIVATLKRVLTMETLENSPEVGYLVAHFGDFGDSFFWAILLIWISFVIPGGLFLMISNRKGIARHFIMLWFLLSFIHEIAQFIRGMDGPLETGLGFLALIVFGFGIARIYSNDARFWFEGR